MAVARKSDVSATSSWLRRRTTTRLLAARELKPIPANVALNSESLSPSTRQRHSPAKNTSVGASRGQTQDNPTRRVPQLKKPLRSTVKPPAFSKPVVPTANNSSTTKTGTRNSYRQKAIPVMPSSDESAPLWLSRLCVIGRHSAIVAFVLVAATLMIYGWTVYSQQVWSQSYRKLQDLQRNERKLTTTTSVLKEKMAQDAQKEPAGLVLPSPQRMIFVPSASNNPNPVSPTTTPTQIQQQPPTPMGAY